MEAEKKDNQLDWVGSILNDQEKVKEIFFTVIINLSDPYRKNQQPYHYWPTWPLEKDNQSEINLIFDNPYNTHMLSTYEYPKTGYVALKHAFQLKNDDYQELMGHSWASVQKRDEDDLISEKHSEKFVHNIHVLLKGQELFGNEDAMNRWLRKFNPFLGANPIDLLKTVTGIEMVLEEIDRLLEGSLA